PVRGALEWGPLRRLVQWGLPNRLAFPFPLLLVRFPSPFPPAALPAAPPARTFPHAPFRHPPLVHPHLVSAPCEGRVPSPVFPSALPAALPVSPPRASLTLPPPPNLVRLPPSLPVVILPPPPPPLIVIRPPAPPRGLIYDHLLAALHPVHHPIIIAASQLHALPLRLLSPTSPPSPPLLIHYQGPSRLRPIHHPIIVAAPKFYALPLRLLPAASTPSPTRCALLIHYQGPSRLSPVDHPIIIATPKLHAFLSLFARLRVVLRVDAAASEFSHQLALVAPVLGGVMRTVVGPRSAEVNRFRVGLPLRASPAARAEQLRQIVAVRLALGSRRCALPLRVRSRREFKLQNIETLCDDE
ncbi:unnamed protein product, partial [Closterium sp. NIES-53]